MFLRLTSPGMHQLLYRSLRVPLLPLVPLLVTAWTLSFTILFMPLLTLFIMLNFEYFSPSEFLTSNRLDLMKTNIDYYFATPDVRSNVENLGTYLDDVRARIGVPIRVNSAVRSPTTNIAVGGARRSRHMSGLAADIAVRSEHMPLLLSILEGDKSMGHLVELINHHSYIHISI